MIKRVLAMLLVGVMLTTLIPMTAFAEEGELSQNVQLTENVEDTAEQAVTQDIEDMEAVSVEDDEAVGGALGDLNWRYDAESKTLTISGSGEMPSYNGNNAYPFYSYHNDITSLVLEEGVENVGVIAFCDYGNLKNISFPSTLININSSSFARCDNLNKLSIPGNVQYIGGFAFSNCSGLSEVILQDGVEAIDNGAFQNCVGLTAIVIPDSVIYIGKNVFNGCAKLSDVYYAGTFEDWESMSGDSGLNDSVTIHTTGSTEVGDLGADLTWLLDKNTGSLTIRGKGEIPSLSLETLKQAPWYEYRDCITLITVENGIIGIGDYSFSNLTNLKKVEISDDIENIGVDVFHGCVELSEIYFGGTQEKWESICSSDSINGDITIHYESLVAKGNCGVLAEWSYSPVTKELMISGSGSMESYNFEYVSEGTIIAHTPWEKYSSEIRSVVINEGIESVGRAAFGGCSALEQISLPDSITSIGSNAFSHCSNLTSVTIPDSVRTIGHYAFEYCTNLTSLHLGNGIKTIGTSAFRYCSGLTGSLVLPDSLESCGWGAFQGCSGFNGTLTIGGNFKGEGFFSDCNFESIVISNDNPYYASYDGIVYSDDLTEVICCPRGKTGEVSLHPQTTKISNLAFYKCTKLSGSLTLPEGVVSIGNDAFANCTGFDGTLTLPDGLAEIGARAFENCAGFNGTLTLPAALVEISTGAFRNCSGFTGNLVIPDGVPAINSETFYGCSGFDGTLTLGNNLEFISQGSFKNCKNFTGGLTVPDSVTWLGMNAFEGCGSFDGSLILSENLESIGENTFFRCGFTGDLVIPDSVTEIGQGAFYYCGFTGSLVIGNGLTELPSNTFGCCNNFTGSLTIGDAITDITGLFATCGDFTGTLKIGASVSAGVERSNFYDRYTYSGRSLFQQIIVSEDNQTYASSDGILYSKDFSLLKWCPDGRPGTATTSEKTQEFENNAFYNCSKLTSIIIPDGATCSIDSDTFQSCTELTNVFIGGGVTIGDSAFKNHTALSTVTISDGVTAIGANAFSGCSSLSKATIPNSITSIGEYAFSGCSSLIKFIIPDKLTTIETGMFSGCTKLNNVIIPDSITLINAYAFYKCSSLVSIILPDGVTSVGGAAFGGCSNLVNVILPDSIISINNSAFSNCSSLQNIALPSGITSINAFTFSGCSSLSGIRIPDGVTSIGEHAFSGCSSMTYVVIPLSVTEINQYGAFDYSTLTDVYYAGSKEQWEDTTSLVWFETNDTITIHYNSTGPIAPTDPEEENGSASSSVLYFSEWDAEARIAYWGGDLLHLGSEVSDGITDVSFLDNIDSLIGSYVLAETKAREDNDVGPNILLSITPVETKIGTVNSLDETTITIDGVTYTLSDDLQGSIIFRFPEDYLGKAVLFHTSDDSVVGIQLVSDSIQERTGLLLFWNEEMHAALIAFDDENGARYCTLYSGGDAFSLDLLKNNLYTDIKCNMIGYTDIVYSANSYSREPDTDSGLQFDYNQPPATNEDKLVAYYANKWYDRYEEFVAAMQEALSKYAGSSEGEKEAAIESCMKEMQENDKNSNSKYLSGTDMDKASPTVKEAAYRGLATVLYDTATDPINLKGINLSSATAGVDLVKRVLGATSESSRSCVCGKYKVTVNILSCSATYFGKLAVIDSTTNNTVASATVCSVRSQAGEAMKTYFDNLTELEKDALKNIYSEISKDVLGQSINSFTKDWMDKAIKKYADKYLSTGVGQLAQNLNTCYNYYLYVGDMMDTAFNAPEDLLIKIGSMEFKDTSITDKAVKKAMSNLEAAKDKLNDVLEAYINGTLNASILDKITLFFNCPVSVAVFDSDGNQIGYVGEDDIWYGDEISIEEMGGAKIIHSYTDNMLSFQIVGTDYGTMSCTIEECDASGDPIGRAVFYDIPIEPSGEFTLNQPENIPSSMDTLALSSSEGNIPIDEYITVNQNGSVSIDCTVETENSQEIGGAIIGTGKYVKGNAVVLRAIPEDGYHFVGWFLDDVLIEVSQTYEFTAKENLQLVAVFSEDFEITEYSITYNLESGTLKEGESNPTVYTELSEEITLINPTRTHYTFAGWIGTDLTEATKTVTIPTGSTGDRTYTATWVRNSGSSESGFAEIDCVSDTSVQLYLSNEEAGTCIVGIYDERGKMIAVGTKAVEAEAREITISYNQVKLPEHYTVKVFLADETNAPLCEAVLQEY